MKRVLFLALLSGATLDARLVQSTNYAYDLVIRHGTIVDGSGLPRFAGDVAIKNGFIVAIGTVRAAAANEIDATGMFVAPGFINIKATPRLRRCRPPSTC